jgi:hypothetical protein
MNQNILLALSPSFWKIEGSLWYPIYQTLLIYSRMTFLFRKLKKCGVRDEIRCRFIDETELKAIWEEEFSRAFDSLYERCKLCAKAGKDYVD